MNYSNLFRKSIDNLSIIVQSVKSQLAVLPQGSLKIYHRKSSGKAYPIFLYCTPDGNRIYIKKNEQLIKDLALKTFLEKELLYLEELLDASQKASNIAEKSHIPYILTQLPKELLPYLSLDNGLNALLASEYCSEEQRAQWNRLPSHANPYDTGERKHRTSDGKYVKSKTELIIYERLLQYKIDFKYEAPLKIGNSVFYPDFTIMLPNGQIIYWEHAGMMQVEEYRLRHKKKMNLYESVGIVPWKNLIVTYDDDDGNLDIRVIDSEIKNKLLS